MPRKCCGDAPRTEKRFKERQSNIIDAVRVRRILKNEHKIAQKNGYRIFYRKKRKPSDKNEREYERMSEIADEWAIPGSAAGRARLQLQTVPPISEKK